MVVEPPEATVMLVGQAAAWAVEGASPIAPRNINSSRLPRTACADIEQDRKTVLNPKRTGNSTGSTGACGSALRLKYVCPGLIAPPFPLYSRRRTEEGIGQDVRCCLGYLNIVGAASKRGPARLVPPMRRVAVVHEPLFDSKEFAHVCR
jgi:hypothetical protein